LEAFHFGGTELVRFISEVSVLRLKLNNAMFVLKMFIVLWC